MIQYISEKLNLSPNMIYNIGSDTYRINTSEYEKPLYLVNEILPYTEGIKRFDDKFITLEMLVDIPYKPFQTIFLLIKVY